MIVEDEPSIRDILVELFDVAGNTVMAPRSLADALDLLRRQPFDFILTDLRLDGKRDGGLQVMALAGLASPDAPLLALTAYQDEANRRAAERLGARHMLEKPADLHAISRLAHQAGVNTAFGPGRSDPSEAE